MRYEEEGTFDLPTRAGIGVAVAWLRQIGMGAVEARNHLMAGRLPAGLAEIPGVDIVNSPKREYVAPGTTLVVPPGGDAAGWRARLQQRYNLRVDDHVPRRSRCAAHLHALLRLARPGRSAHRRPLPPKLRSTAPRPGSLPHTTHPLLHDLYTPKRLALLDCHAPPVTKIDESVENPQQPSRLLDV